MRNFFVVLVFASAVMYIHGQMLGGITTQDPNDPEYMVKAWKAAKEVKSNGENLMIPIKVKKAKSQVVAGVRYILEVLYGESTCLKVGSITPAMMATYCRRKKGGSKALYKVEIWEKPWQNFEKYTVTKIRDIAAGK
ncbi:cystatin domain protein [Ancylostoma caninum]|uniref:Cystatin domain protein n=1 Tax=Ancylostoma caninum TaxID=29170 RepID=A0A368GVS9_ANCCA|nr:cystatin domain protein [Ancylostoma caninum]